MEVRKSFIRRTVSRITNTRRGNTSFQIGRQISTQPAIPLGNQSEQVNTVYYEPELAILMETRRYTQPTSDTKMDFLDQSPMREANNSHLKEHSSLGLTSSDQA
jgi:hypothetical protein